MSITSSQPIFYISIAKLNPNMKNNPAKVSLIDGNYRPCLCKRTNVHVCKGTARPGSTEKNAPKYIIIKKGFCLHYLDFRLSL